MNIPFSPPDIAETEIAQVVESLRSGWITTGPKTKRLEQKVAQMCHTKKAVCLSSQTSSAETTLRILGVGPGDEVILPAYTYTATASVVCHVGATPIMIDCQENSYEMDYDAMEAAITERTKVIIPVDIAGVVCDYDRIFGAVERKKNLFTPSENEIQKALGRVIVMADTAHSFGACRNGKMSGEIADFSNFSFHAVKNLTTAEGGAATWKEIDGIDSDAIYKKYQLLSLHGQTKDAFEKSAGASWEYDVVDAWYKCNMPDVLAAIGLGQISRYDSMIQRRHEIISRYNQAFEHCDIQVLNHKDEAHRSSGHLYLVRFLGEAEDFRNRFYEDMKALGVSCNVHFKPLPLLTAYKKRGYDIKNYPNAYNQFKNVLTLPLYSTLTDEQVEYIICSFLEVYKKLKSIG